MFEAPGIGERHPFAVTFSGCARVSDGAPDGVERRRSQAQDHLGSNNLDLRQGVTSCATDQITEGDSGIHLPGFYEGKNVSGVRVAKRHPHMLLQ
jgi:hypothetical protein